MMFTYTKVSSLPRNLPKSAINLTQVRTSFYNKYRHGPTKRSNPDIDYFETFKSFFGQKGIDFVKKELHRTFLDKPFRSQLEPGIIPNKTYIFEHFDSDEALKKWKPVADSDSANGFSTSKLIRSPAGHALFTGILDNRVPDDGLTMQSGFAGIIGPKKERDHMIGLNECWDWSNFNCLEIKFRGDGRKYAIMLNTADYYTDITWYDVHGIPLYTRGGPYWQTIKIPFSKFIFSSKGFVQDTQGPFPDFMIKFVSLVLQDTYDGPFSLEIDYIGLSYDTLPFFEETSYETYSFPHIRWLDIHPGCDPPDD